MSDSRLGATRRFERLATRATRRLGQPCRSAIRRFGDSSGSAGVNLTGPSQLRSAARTTPALRCTSDTGCTSSLSQANLLSSSAIRTVAAILLFENNKCFSVSGLWLSPCPGASLCRPQFIKHLPVLMNISWTQKYLLDLSGSSSDEFTQWHCMNQFKKWQHQHGMGH
jgi:hypothetical protein